MELTLQEKRKLIEFFEFLLDKEISKPLGEMNSEAVDNYIKILLHLQDKHVELSPEFIDEQVRKIFHPEETAPPEAVKTTKKQYSKNKIWLVAACIAILVALFSIVSVANDWNVFDFLSEKFGSVHSTPVEEELDFNGVSVIMNGKSSIHMTMEDALEFVKEDILYPKQLPNDTTIIDIMIYEEDSVNKMIYSFTDPYLYSEIYFNMPLAQSVKENATKTTKINSIECYVCKMPDISCIQVGFEYKGNAYMFSHTDEKVLVEIIENLEEINNEN